MKTKGKSRIILLISVLLIGFLCFVGIKGVNIAGYRLKPFKETVVRGLDLQGGVSVTMEVSGDKKVSEDQLNDVKSQLELRVNSMGVAETVVVVEGDNRIKVDIPGVYESSDMVSQLSTTGELTFRNSDGDVLLSGSDVKSATVTTDQQTGYAQVSLTMTDEGTKKFAEATTTYLNKTISIYMDEEELVSPTVNATITDGKAVISGNYTVNKAKNLAALINSGSLPVTLKAVSVQTVGAQLGAESLPSAVKAGIIGLALVALFMIVYYRVPGVISVVALSFYTFLVLFIFEEIGATLTLPGIAAFLLTVGMAVDANVLIFERIREELRNGVSIKAAIDRGFNNAFTSIIDSNLTTIIVALVLYFFGSVTVKGFSVTLMIGIICSLFTALVITKFLLKQSVSAGILKTIGMFRVKKDEKTRKEIKVVSKKKIWFSISAIIILVGIGFTVFKGLNFGIDFAGGSTIVLQCDKNFDKAKADKVVTDYAKDAVTNTVDNDQYQIKSKDLTSDNFDKLYEKLKKSYGVTEIVSQEQVGASIGSDLTSKSIKALIISFIAMLLYIAIRFEFKFGLAALVALLHDVLITISMYAIFDIAINTPFIASILTIIGYSINATIVIFDRVRSNMKGARVKSIDDQLDKSVNQTIARSINTSLTTLFTIVAVLIFVPSVRSFSLPITVGIISGTYSSVFIAPSFYSLIKGKKKKVKKA